MTPDSAITVLVPTSPIPSHPSTHIIDRTIESIKHWLPKAEIIVMCDGIRDEQRKQYKERYNEYLCKLMDPNWGNFVMFFKDHVHQIGMTRQALKSVKTPLVLFAEHDTGLVTDRPIDWQGIVDALLSGDVNCVRLHYESRICPYHLYLFEEQFESHGVPLWKTRQWCQRPHIATTELYRCIMGLFTEKANCMIEDRLMTFVQNSLWDDWRVAVYNPPDSMHRSLHLDGRGADPKFEDSMVF